MTDNDCIICFECISNKFTGSCQHSFCKHCIEKWAKENNICPLCRDRNIVKFCKRCNSTSASDRMLCVDCQFEIVDEKFAKDNMDIYEDDLHIGEVGKWYNWPYSNINIGDLIDNLNMLVGKYKKN